MVQNLSIKAEYSILLLSPFSRFEAMTSHQVLFLLLTLSFCICTSNGKKVSCVGKNCSCRYKLQKKSNEGWFDVRNSENTIKYYCVQVWGSKPMKVYGCSDCWERLSRNGQCKRKKCHRRAFGGIKCRKGSLTWLTNVYKCY